MERAFEVEASDDSVEAASGTAGTTQSAHDFVGHRDAALYPLVLALCRFVHEQLLVLSEVHKLFVGSHYSCRGHFGRTSSPS